MPNHITNIITAPKHVIDSIINGDGDVDFSLIIPEPANLERGGCPGDAVGGIHYVTGEVCWYEWSIKNWGTKWNAYATERISDTEIRFDTAWAHPIPFIEAIIEKFPEDDLEIMYADEDTGYNFGHYLVVNKNPMSMDLPEEGTPEATLWAYRLKYDPEATMQTLVDDGYEF